MKITVKIISSTISFPSFVLWTKGDSCGVIQDDVGNLLSCLCVLEAVASRVLEILAGSLITV